MTTASITALEMFTQQQLPSQHWRCQHDNSFHHSTGDVHTATTTAQHARSIIKQNYSTKQRLFGYRYVKEI